MQPPSPQPLSRSAPRFLLLATVLLSPSASAISPLATQPLGCRPLSLTSQQASHPAPQIHALLNSRLVLQLRGGNDEAAAEKELGNQAYKAKDFDTAIEHYEKASEMDPTSMVYINNIAAAYFGKGEYEKCIETCKKAVEVGKEHRADFKDMARSFARMGNAYMKLKKLEEAVKEYDNSLMEFRDPQVELKRKDAIRIKEKEDAEAYLDPEKSEEARQAGNALFKEGKWPEAIKQYTEGIKRDPNNHLCYSNRAQTFIKVMDFGSALKDCEKCIELKPDFPRAYARKATVQLLCKQVHKAKETVEAGLTLNPDDAELKEVQRKVSRSIMGVGLTPEEREQRAQEAMKDPHIQTIMQDPIMREVLNDMSTNPASAAKHMQDPGIKQKVETLMAAGIIQMG